MRFFLTLTLLCTALTLTACYQPLYGSKSLGGVPTAQEDRLNDIFIGPVDGEVGQKLRNLLIDRMYGQGRPAQPSKRLDINLTLVEEHLGLQKNATTTRARLNATATYSLHDSASAAPVTSHISISTINTNDTKTAATRITGETPPTSETPAATAAAKPLFTGTSRSVVSFDILDQEYATLSNREDAQNRALREIADLMVNRLLLYFGENK